MKVLVSGSSGLIGTALIPLLRAAGHDIRPLSRRAVPASSPANLGGPADLAGLATPNPSAEIFWNTGTGELDRTELARWGRPDAVVHLAGENIAARRWSPAQKQILRESRVAATAGLAAFLARLPEPPACFVSASAVGIYGDRGDEELCETSSVGNGFLGELAQAWENAAQPLVAAGTRVVWLRFGMILSARGGALARMRPIFKLGLGGPLGSGRQWMSWISAHDTCRLIRWALETDSARGAYVAASPHPVRNADFTRELGRVWRRPAFLPVPAAALRLIFGEMGREVLLASQRARSIRLPQEGFEFSTPTLRAALEAELEPELEPELASPPPGLK